MTECPIIGGSNAKEEMRAMKTEYLITQYASDGKIVKQLHVPKSVNLQPRKGRANPTRKDTDDSWGKS